MAWSIALLRCGTGLFHERVCSVSQRTDMICGKGSILMETHGYPLMLGSCMTKKHFHRRARPWLYSTLLHASECWILQKLYLERIRRVSQGAPKIGHIWHQWTANRYTMQLVVGRTVALVDKSLVKKGQMVLKIIFVTPQMYHDGMQHLQTGWLSIMKWVVRKLIYHHIFPRRKVLDRGWIIDYNIVLLGIL